MSVSVAELIRVMAHAKDHWPALEFAAAPMAAHGVQIVVSNNRLEASYVFLLSWLESSEASVDLIRDEIESMAVAIMRHRNTSKEDAPMTMRWIGG